MGNENTKMKCQRIEGDKGWCSLGYEATFDNNNNITLPDSLPPGTTINKLGDSYILTIPNTQNGSNNESNNISNNESNNGSIPSWTVYNNEGDLLLLNEDIIYGMNNSIHKREKINSTPSWAGIGE